MKTMSYLILLLVLVGCGKGVNPNTGIRDAAFEVYFQNFETVSIAQGRDTFGDDNITIQFGTLTGTENGQCTVTALAGRIVHVDKTWWDETPDTNYRESLIFHELGHCLLNRIHRPGLIPGLGLPLSIMNPSAPTGEDYSYDKAYYQKELFLFH